MAFSPFARFRNFTTDNLKALLEVYPDLSEKSTWKEVGDSIGPGYKKTSYQQACQLGLEDRSDKSFKMHTYLYTFDDDYLDKYMRFWIKTYYAPNPYVNSDDESLILFSELAKEILSSEGLKVDFYDFFNRRIGGKSDDILLNAIKSYGDPIKYIKEGEFHYFYVDENEKDQLNDLVNIIENEYPIIDSKSKKEFFERYSFDNFCKFYGINTEVKAIDNSDEKQKERFIEWLSKQCKSDGTPYNKNTIDAYIYAMERAYGEFDKFRDCNSPFEIRDSESVNEYMTYLFTADGYAEFREKMGNRACEGGWSKYKEFLIEEEKEPINMIYNTKIKSDKPRNRIFFGAPGTGKSYTMNKERKELLGDDNETDYERVTFHPDYSYANFVGSYKPVPKGNAITYEYVPGPFMRVYVNAIRNGMTDSPKPYLLIIEEINRANVAAVFGDIFQLLDRDDNEVSEYPIQISEDAKQYLSKELGGKPEDFSSIRIPNNMFIWATMNSADQGVFPMDTAFKRRWNFTYIGINHNQDKIKDKTVSLEVKVMGDTKEIQKFRWNDLRIAINDMLASLKVNEDKMLGTFFLSNKVLGESDEIDPNVFKEVFKSKVIMYLFEDAARQRRDEVFEGAKAGNKALRYSEICDDFDKRGVEIFNDSIIKSIDFIG